MSLQPFELLVGAPGDVKELEYISSLHQTDVDEVRKDASIKAEDIRLFLSSRYGIAVSEEKVRKVIISGLGGGSEGDDVLDLVELVAMLLIPTFLKAAVEERGDSKDNVSEQVEIEQEQPETKKTGSKLPEGVQPTPPGMLSHVLKMILHDVTGSHAPKELTPELIKRILAAYGEHSLANNDELISEMLDGATGKACIFDPAKSDQSKEDKEAGHKPMLDVKTFAEALTYDIKLYDIRNEVRDSTNLDDIFVTDETIEQKEQEMFLASNQAELDKAFDEGQGLRDRFAVSTKLERKNTLPAIDLTAETYRSKGLIVALWATILITYFAYFFRYDREIERVCGDEYTYEFDSPWGANQGAMICEALVSIFVWLYFFSFMSVFGIVCVYIGSIGNEVDCREPWKPITGSCAILLLVTISYGVLKDKEVNENAILYIASLVLGLICCGFHLSRAVTMLVEPGKLEDLQSCLPVRIQSLFSSSVSAEANIKQAAARKLNALTVNALKVVKTTDQDNVLGTHYGQALRNYSSGPKQFQTAGGFFWTWRRIIDGTNMFARDGIWLPARMVASNIAQYIVAIYILFAGLALTERVSTEYDKDWAKRQANDFINKTFGTESNEEAADALVENVTSIVSQYMTAREASGTDFGCSVSSASAEEIIGTYCSSGEILVCDTSAPVNYLCPLLNEEQASGLNPEVKQALLSGSGFDETLLKQVARDAMQQAADDSVDTLYPAEKYMILAPMYIGTIIAFIMAFSLALIYIPSVTTTILRLRTGAIATLRNKEFNRYRRAADQVAVLTGSIFWGSLASELYSCWFNLWLHCFLFCKLAAVTGAGGSLTDSILHILSHASAFQVWQATAYYAQRLVALIIGILCATLVRLVIVITCRCLQYKSFYRERPGAANLSMLALEWANLAVSAGFVLIRMIKIMLVAASFIGRIDTPFLAPSIGRVLCLELDNFPNVHLKDVLSHEAHRHPYIELLGAMYLMKLRYEGYFGQRAGACWRLIFMHALMPWLDKYRILARPEEADDDKKAELEEKYPSLTFVSLHNVYAEIGGDAGNEDLTEDHEDEDSNEAIPSRSVLLTGRRRRSRQRSTNADEARMRMLEEEAKAQCIQISKLEEDCKSLEKGSEAKRHRIMKLEKEVKRLKAVLDTSIASEEPSHTNNNGNGGNDAREMEA